MFMPTCIRCVFIMLHLIVLQTWLKNWMRGKRTCNIDADIDTDGGGELDYVHKWGGWEPFRQGKA